jgi:hypothetical protein
LTSQITTVVVQCNSAGFSGDGGLAINAHSKSPADVVLDTAGNMLIADFGNFYVRKEGRVLV